MDYNSYYQSLQTGDPHLQPGGGRHQRPSRHIQSMPPQQQQQYQQPQQMVHHQPSPSPQMMHSRLDSQMHHNQAPPPNMSQRANQPSHLMQGHPQSMQSHQSPQNNHNNNNNNYHRLLIQQQQVSPMPPHPVSPSIQQSPYHAPNYMTVQPKHGSSHSSHMLYQQSPLNQPSRSPSQNSPSYTPNSLSSGGYMSAPSPRYSQGGRTPIPNHHSQQPVRQHSVPQSHASPSLGPSPSRPTPPQTCMLTNSSDQVSPPFYHQNISRSEFRIIELNRRLQARPRVNGVPSPLPTAGASEEGDWWERFACDFFDEEASLSLRFPIENSHTGYSIGRTLIPRFFRSYFDGGVMDLQINLRNTKETQHHNSNLLTLDCGHATIVTKNYLKQSPNLPAPVYLVVHTEGRLSLDFISNSCNDSLLIKSWTFFTHQCHEYVDRSMTRLKNTNLVDPVTRNGLTKSTIAFLKMCMIMQPMQDLMVRSQRSGLDPKTCLTRLLEENNYFEALVENATSHLSSHSHSNSMQLDQPTLTTENSDNRINTKRKANIKPKTKVKPKSKPNTKSKSSINSNININTNTSSDTNTSNDININTSIDVKTNSGIINSCETNTNTNSSSDIKINTNTNSDIKLNTNALNDSSSININATSNNISNNNNGNETVVNNSDSSVSEPCQRASPEPITPVEKPEPSIPQDREDNCPMALIVAEPPPESSNNDSSDNNISNVNDDNPINNNNNNNNTNDDDNITSNNSSDNNSDNINNSNLNENNANNNSGSSDNNNSNNSSNSNNINNQSNGSVPESCLTTNPEPIVPIEKLKEPSVLVSRLPPSSKQNRRRSSERKETLREGLMRTSDFVVAMKDLKSEHPALWRITTGNNLLQQFEPKTQNGVVLYENTNQYAGWNPEIKRDYVGVDVKLTQHTRNQITVERLHLNFQKIEDVETFYDRHFAIYIQILLSTALDPKFWESIENEPKHHDYFLTTRRIIDDITKRFKLRLSNKLKLSETVMRNIEKYPNISIKPVKNSENAQLCRACNTSTCTQVISFGNRSYDLHSYKPVKVTNERSVGNDENSQNHLCDSCLEVVKLYSDIHHMSWKFFNIAREKVDHHKTEGKPINVILDECLKDEDWLMTIYAERDDLWSKIENIK